MFGPRHLFAALASASCIAVWERGTFRPLPSLTPPAGGGDGRLPGAHLALSADGKLVALFGGASGSPGQASIWEVGSWQALGSFRPGSASVQAVAFLPGTRVVATGDEAGHLALWQLAAGQAPTRLFGIDFPKPAPGAQGSPFAQRITGLAFSPRGDRLIVGLDLDGADVRIYDVKFE
jgi:WD40 repeat protein